MSRLLWPAWTALCMVAPVASGRSIEEATAAPVDELLVPGQVILVGEVHGTVEAPAFVADLVRRARKVGKPVTVGLEIWSSETAATEAFLASSGKDEAVRAFLSTPFWSKAVQGGRSSVAMFELIDELRSAGARTTKGDLRVLLFDNADYTTGAERDRGMAERLAHAVDGMGLVIVLSGNVHNRLTVGTGWDSKYEPMGYHLKGSLQEGLALVSLDMASHGGQAWACVEECGLQTFGGDSELPIGGFALFDGVADRPFSGRWFCGPMHASLPAKRRLAAIKDE